MENKEEIDQFTADMPDKNEQVSIRKSDVDPNYGLIRIETIRAGLVAIAILGSIGLGVFRPDLYAQAASVTLSAVTGGYFGLARQSSRN